jgi:uncharacterized protein YijF (DUF1287 family)
MRRWMLLASASVAAVSFLGLFRADGATVCGAQVERIGFAARFACADESDASARFRARLVSAAEARAKAYVVYDGSYRRIPYPNGDVPPGVGVCSDEIVRAYRGVGIDLQREVHEDMESAFGAYPKTWHERAPDSNIDHRRVPNLMTFFARRGVKLPIAPNPANYHPGEVVAWELRGGLTHIGIVVNGRSADGGRPLVLHNIGEGPRIEDALFVGRIIGHYRYPKR